MVTRGTTHDLLIICIHLAGMPSFSMDEHDMETKSGMIDYLTNTRISRVDLVE